MSDDNLTDLPIHSGFETSSDVREKIPEWAGNTIGSILILLFIVSATGNIAVVFILGRNRHTRRVHLFQINLAICELLSPLLTYWMTIVGAFAKHWPFGEHACYYYGFMSSWLALNSISCLTAVSVERYVVISRPFLERRLTVELKIGFALITWVYSFFLAVPPLLGLSQYKLEGYGISCSFDHLSRDRQTRSYIFYLFWGGLILPVALIAFSYTKIFLQVRNSRHLAGNDTPNKRRESRQRLASNSVSIAKSPNLSRANSLSCTDRHLHIVQMGKSCSVDESQSNSNPDETAPMRRTKVRFRSTSREIQLAKVILLATLVFIISWVPYSVMSITAQFGPEGIVGPAVMSVTSILAKLSVVYNPFIYWYKDDNFRRNLKLSLFGKRISTSSAGV